MTAADVSLLRGKLVVISGPSGAGKTTLVRQVFRRSVLPLVHSVSATTRAPRQGEVHGRDYYFLDEAEFAARRTRGDFLECCQVFGRGDWYGTLRSQVDPSLAAGNWVVLEIDVQGARAVLEQHPDALTIFVRPQSLAELERRLRERGSESETSLARRLEAARRELASAEMYRFQVINDDLQRAVDEICEILAGAATGGM